MQAAKEQVNLRGLIASTFYAVHHAIGDKLYDEIWLSGGRGSGKSSFVSLEIVLGMLADPEANAIIYRKVADTLRDSVYTQMLWAIEALKIQHLWRTGVSPMELVYTLTGQRIIFRGMDKAEKSKGLKLKKGYFKFLWFEELTEFLSMKEIRTVKASVIRGAAATIFYSYNPPQSAMNWVNGEAITRRKSRLVHSSDYRDLPREWLGEDFIREAEALREQNEREYRWMYLGEVTGVGGNVFENLDVRAIKPVEWESLPVYLGHDFGFANDPDATVKCAYSARRKTLYIVGESLGKGLSLSALAQAMKKIAQGQMITADSEDPRGISELRSQGVRIIGARKGPGSVDRGLKWLQTLARIVIDPNACPNTAREFQTYEYERGKDDQFIPRYPDGNNHTIDATRYALESVIGRRVAIAVK